MNVESIVILRYMKKTRRKIKIILETIIYFFHEKRYLISIEEV